MAGTIWDQLRAPFPREAVGWKPQVITGNRCLVAAYIDARDVMDRLDEVVGGGDWWDSYSVLDAGCVACRLTLRISDREVSKEDVGGPSDQKDVGDRLKAAFSDALKRAAVKFGIGRYLYALPMQWMDYDPQKKAIIGTPRLVVPGEADTEPAPKEPAAKKTTSNKLRDNATMMARVQAAAEGTGLTPGVLAKMVDRPSFAAVEVGDFDKLMAAIAAHKEEARD